MTDALVHSPCQASGWQKKNCILGVFSSSKGTKTARPPCLASVRRGSLEIIVIHSDQGIY
jgi:hypothetical protein